MISFFCKKYPYETHMSYEQKRCRVAGGGGGKSFVLDFLFLLYEDKRKTQRF